MATLDGKVAFVTGAGRGQGRCHAVRLAEEGASVIAIDVTGPVAEHNGYPATTPEDLEQTRMMLAATAGRHHVAIADVRDSAGVIWLASDRSRAVTGTQLTVDMGATKI
jgi:NAD(P)-dependent dehydrogenase (short-subunit alcohol dehydrogenase family)